MRVVRVWAEPMFFLAIETPRGEMVIQIDESAYQNLKQSEIRPPIPPAQEIHSKILPVELTKPVDSSEPEQLTTMSELQKRMEAIGLFSEEDDSGETTAESSDLEEDVEQL